ncbi:MAG: YidC/Oxa1 family membrane protein insertase [Clostridiales bacterium]|nr:YidC/Oxa1 family membrane protein insertase [Clostridiales bacterium]
MEITVLSQVTGILGPFAWIMGQILNGIYAFLNLFGITNIALCIVLFTIVVKMLMLPLTIKQQKGTRLSAKMNPEIQKIQAKYKGKKDQESMQRQQAEMQEVYAKYGTSPMAGCLPLLISLPIMFALYQVIYKIPAYVNDINGLYNTVAMNFMGVEGYAEALKNFLEGNKITSTTVGNLATLVPDSDAAKTLLIDIFSKFNTNDWNLFLDASKWSGYNGTEIVNYFTNANGLAQLKEVIAMPEVITKVDEIKHVNRFIADLNILDPAGWGFPGIIIPIFAAASQFLQSKLMMVQQTNKSSEPAPGGDTMKAMNTVMPVVSGIFCTFMPIGVGIYWITSSVVQIVQQIFINKYFDKIDLDEMIAKNVEKSNKRKEKLGVATGNKMASVAKTSTKVINNQQSNLQSKATVNTKKTEASNYKKSEVSYKAGSIAANANILKRNNSDKGDK